MDPAEKTPLQQFISKALQLMPQKRDWYDRRIQETTGTKGKPIYDIERGRSTNPERSTLRLVAAVLGQPLDLLLLAADGRIVEPAPPGEPPPTNVREIPVYGRVPGGSPREMEEDVIGATFVSNDLPDEAFALEVSGDSMDLIAPDATDVIVNPRDTAFWDTDLYVVRDADGDLTFKRYMEKPARLVPCSSNPKHAEIILGSRPINVVGKVIQVNIGLAHLRKMGMASK